MVLLKIVMAALANIIIGYIWYHPAAFGRKWMLLVNLSPEMVERGRSRSRHFMFVGIVTSFIVAILSRMALVAANVNSLSGALFTACALWLGFVASTELLETIWEERPLPLFVINTGYWFLSLVVMMLILY